MFLCYVDESGNSGKNLSDPSQPFHIAGGVAVHDSKWKLCNAGMRDVVRGAAKDLRKSAPDVIRKDFNALRAWAKLVSAGKPKAYRASLKPDDVIALLPDFLTNKFELHATNLCAQGAAFIGVPDNVRRRLVNAVIDVYLNNACEFFAGFVDKQRLFKKYGDDAHPPAHLAMIPLVEQFDEWLKGKSEHGILIADAVDDPGEHKRRLAIYQERSTPYSMGSQIVRVIDSIHFVDSAQSYLVQLADLVTYVYAQHRLGGTRWTKEWDRVKVTAHCKPFYVPS